jgi:hypothetical protein
MKTPKWALAHDLVLTAFLPLCLSGNASWADETLSVIAVRPATAAKRAETST